jgi:hypothetical protein
MGLIPRDITEAYEKRKTASLWPEKDHVCHDVKYGDGESGEMAAEIVSKRAFRHCGASRAHFVDRLV